MTNTSMVFYSNHYRNIRGCSALCYQAQPPHLTPSLKCFHHLGSKVQSFYLKCLQQKERKICHHLKFQGNVEQLPTLKGFSLRYGGSPSIISMAITPKLQISTFGPYCFLQWNSVYKYILDLHYKITEYSNSRGHIHL